MRISIITPAPAHTRNGNRNTATRWAAFLRAAGHRVTVTQHWDGSDAQMMIALHARRSHDAIARYAQHYVERPLVVVLTGTDLYRDIAFDTDARQSLALATRLVVLQDDGVDVVCEPYRPKVRVVYQSAREIPRQPPLKSCFEIVVSGYLRAEKDPFRAAAALEYLPAASRIRVTHIGGALSGAMEAEAREWMSREPRYRWLGERPHWRTLRILARARAMVISSRMEGGANVVSEALTIGVPVVASDISGNIGMLGHDYAGYYPVGDERALGGLIDRTERDPAFYAALEASCRDRARLVEPERERAALDALISELT